MLTRREALTLTGSALGAALLAPALPLSALAQGPVVDGLLQPGPLATPGSGRTTPAAPSSSTPR